MALSQTIEAESAARQFTGLVEMRARVGRIAGGELDLQASAGDAVGSAYGDAAPIVQRRWDTLAAEVSAWAETGVAALAASGSSRKPSAAAARLADELDQAIAGLTKLLRI